MGDEGLVMHTETSGENWRSQPLGSGRNFSVGYGYQIIPRT